MTDTQLQSFAALINDKAETFAVPSASNPVSRQALQLITLLFNASLKEESNTLPLYSNLLEELAASKPTTRAQAKKQKPVRNDNLLPTSLESLYTQDEDENTWAQLDLKYAKLAGLAKQVMGSNGFEEEDAAMDDAEPESDDELVDEEDLDEESDLSSEIADDESIDSQVGQESIQALTAPSPPKSARKEKMLSLANFDEPTLSQGPIRKGKPSAVDDDFFSLEEFQQQSEMGEFRMAKGLAKKDGDESSEDEDDDLDLFSALPGTGDSMDVDELEIDGVEDLEDVADVTYASFFDPPSRLPRNSKPVSSPKSASRANKSQKDEQSAKKKRALEDDPDASAVSNKSVRFNNDVRVKSIAARPNRDDDEEVDDLDEDEEEEEEGLGMELDELDGSLEDLQGDSDEEESEAEEDGEMLDDQSEVDEEGEAIDRFKNDLFEEEEEDEEEGALSRHEKRMSALSAQITEMEQENIGKKDWTLSGESRSRDRPVNSLLEESLEFEHMAKSAPIITAERTLSLEDKIKARILEERFDDVEKRLPFDPKAFLPSRLLDISGKQSEVGLGELYADEYSEQRQKAEGREVVDVRDAKLDKEHKEIEQLFDIVCGKLDALSNAHFTPKAPQTTIQSTSNVSTVSMEDALPTTSTTSTLLAPEEVYAQDANAANQDKSDMTPAQKRALHQKGRQQRKKNADKVDKLSGANSNAAAKEKARKDLIGTRGVSVIGKDGRKQKDVKGQGSKNADSAQNGVRFKL